GMRACRVSRCVAPSCSWRPSSRAFGDPHLLLLNTRGVQALLQQQNLLIAFDASALLLCFEESGGCRSAAADFLLASCFSIDALALRYLGSGSSASDFLDRQQVANRRFEG